MISGFQQENTVGKNIPVQCKRDRTRCAIVEAAIDIIADKGLDAASIDELMRAAGMARGTFYNYFQSRDEVLAAVVCTLQSKIRDAVESSIPEGLAPAQVVTCMIYGFTQFCLDRPQLGWTWVRIGGGDRWLMTESPSAPTFARSDAALAEIIDEDLSYLLAICYIQGVSHNVVWRLLEGHITMEDADRILQLLLRGLGMTAKQIASSTKMAREFAVRIHHELTEPENRLNFGVVSTK
jgi:AcrR family transcriptional regulator